MSDDLGRVSVNARVDIRHLAALAIYLKSKGSPPKNRSDLIHQCIAILHDVLEESGYLVSFSSAEKALAVLSSMGLHWPFGTKGHKSVVSVLQTDARLREALETILQRPEDNEEIIEELETLMDKDE